MNFRSVVVIAVIGLLLVSTIDAAKKGGKGKKGGKEAGKYASEEKGARAEKVKVEKRKAVKEEVAEEEEPVQIKDSKIVVVSEPLPEETGAAAAPAAKIIRPKTMKVLTPYEQCKQDCRRVREQQDLHAYAAQLREELTAAEAAIEAENNAAAAAAEPAPAA